MAQVKTCRICGKTIWAGRPYHFVKVKGDRALRWYCKECVKGGHKDGTARKGN